MYESSNGAVGALCGVRNKVSWQSISVPIEGMEARAVHVARRGPPTSFAPSRVPATGIITITATGILTMTAQTRVSAVLSGHIAALVDTGDVVKVDAGRQICVVRRVGRSQQ